LFLLAAVLSLTAMTAAQAGGHSTSGDFHSDASAAPAGGAVGGIGGELRNGTAAARRSAGHAHGKRATTMAPSASDWPPPPANGYARSSKRERVHGEGRNGHVHNDGGKPVGSDF